MINMTNCADIAMGFVAFEYLFLNGIETFLSVGGDYVLDDTTVFVVFGCLVVAEDLF